MTGTGELISIIIRVRNAEEDLRVCIASVKMQDLYEEGRIEIIVVDNESDDNTLSVADQCGAKIVHISRDEFSWGGALNKGIDFARGAIIVNLSADAWLVNRTCIRAMVNVLENKAVAAVYGRQIPKKDAPVDERIRLKKQFPDVAKIFDLSTPGVSPSGQGMIVSNTFAAIRKELWQKTHYREHVAGEEGFWSYEMIQQGRLICYEPKAVVFHSHNDSFFRQSCRLVELIKKNCEIQNQRLTFKVLVFSNLSYIKRRIVNCFSPEIPMWVRIQGIICLPVEVMANTISFFYICTSRYERYRNRVWG